MEIILPKNCNEGVFTKIAGKMIDFFFSESPVHDSVLRRILVSSSEVNIKPQILQRVFDMVNVVLDYRPFHTTNNLWVVQRSDLCKSDYPFHTDKILTGLGPTY